MVGFFWFCVIVWVSTYTANLASVLSTSQENIPISNLEDVLEREYHPYVIRGTAFTQFLANSEYRIYSLLWERISAEKSVVNTTAEGFQKVRQKEENVFIEESPFSEYLVHNEPCNVMSSM